MTAKPRIPEIVLERYRLHELPADEAARGQTLADGDAGVRARLSEIERSDADFPAPDLARRIERGVRERVARPDRVVGSGLPAMVAVPLVVVVAALLFLVVPRDVVRPGSSPPPAPPADAGDRIKGLR